MSFFDRLFRRPRSAKGEVSSVPETVTLEYKGFTIRATPVKEGRQFRLCGVIEKFLDGEVKTHRFVRADQSPNVDDMSDMALQKGRLMIDQQGDGLFS